jgi:hypothetical protein
MEDHLQNLKNALFASSSKQEDLNDKCYADVYQQLCDFLGESLPDGVNPMEWVAERTYETDNVGVLCLIFCDNLIDSDLDYFESDFEEGDWFEENEEHEMMENEYGEEGIEYYFVYTKMKKHIFSEAKPFSNGVEYDRSDDRFIE